MLTYIACVLSDFCHEVTNCIELLESLSFLIAFCQSCRPPTTESCSFAKWPHLWQSWRTISAIATSFIYALMVSARGRRTVQPGINTTGIKSHLCTPSVADFTLFPISAVVLAMLYGSLMKGRLSQIECQKEQEYFMKTCLLFLIKSSRQRLMIAITISFHVIF